MRRLSGLLCLITLLGCHDEIIDGNQVCVSAKEVDGQLRLVVEAYTSGCESDHKGASLECSIETEGFDAHIQTVQTTGKDPNDACGQPLLTTCSVDVEPGIYTLHYAGETLAIQVPSEEQGCLPSGAIPFGTEG